MHENLPSRLSDAVARGIITAAQREEILALPDTAPPGAEARGLNAVTVAYYLGALMVLFAAAYFLMDRWLALRPGGVLLVSLAYAVAFAAAALLFRRRGFRLAEGVAATLVVVMVSVTSWALANLAGVWAPYDVLIPIRPPGAAAWDSGKWLIPQIATIVGALIAARLVRYPLVLAPAAFAAWSITIPLTELAFGLTLGGFMVARVSLLVGTIMIAVGYMVDRRTRTRGWGFWIYLFGALATFIGMVQTASDYHLVRHLSPLVSLAAVAFSLRIGQKLFLVAGVLGLIVYLGHLAFDVFSGTVLFPVALAALGLGIIVATVWMQRAYPVLAARMGAGPGAARRVPGDLVTMLVPAALALLLLAISVPRERARAEEQLLQRERLREQMEQIELERAPVREPGL